MAFQKGRSGDRLLIQQGLSVVPKSYDPARYIAAWNARTVPQVGDLVKLDPGASTAVIGSDAVQQCVASDVPYGMVWSLNSNTALSASVGQATLSILKFNKIFSITLEVADMSTVTLGHSVQVAGTSTSAGTGTIKINGQLRDRVKDVAFAAGSGLIVSVSALTGVGLVVVEWPN